MKKEQLSDAIGCMDEDILLEAMSARTRPVRRYRRAWVAVAACLCVLTGCLLTVPFLPHEQPVTDGSDITYLTNTAPTTTTTQSTSTQTTSNHLPSSGTPMKDVKVLAFAEYPTMARRPAAYEEAAHTTWWNSLQAQRRQLEEHTDGMSHFYTKTMQTFLQGEAGENRVYSPLNLYIALSMLAETTEGNSRSQVLDLLDVSDMTALRRKNHALWNGVYLDDGAVLSRLANSLWLAEGERWKYDTATVQNLAYNYYASTYKGIMGSEMYNRVLQGWLNDQTEGLLKEQAGDLKFDPDVMLALASTVCFRAKWTDEFSPHATQAGTFHAAAGDITCDFMKRGDMNFAYFGDAFTAVRMGLDDGAYAMTIFLPHEGVAVGDLTGDSQVLEVLQNPDRSAIGKYMQVQMSIPKFDVVSDRDLADGLRALGVTDVFDMQKGDFTGILTEQTEPVYLSQVQHAARVAIDKEGVTAVAYTVELLAGAGAPDEILEFTADRPFLFAITGPGETILFAGVVETPQ